MAAADLARQCNLWYPNCYMVETVKKGEPPVRRFIRKPVAAQIRSRDNAGQGHLFFDSQDLSVGGAFLRADLLLEQGDLLDLEFTLPDGGPSMEARARVAWVRSSDSEQAGSAGMGVEFLNLSPTDREALATFLEEN
jgi:uncharacterized protein (TIGR02266 family)